jgi:hypothetical protein
MSTATKNEASAREGIEKIDARSIIIIKDRNLYDTLIIIHCTDNMRNSFFRWGHKLEIKTCHKKARMIIAR